MSREPLQAAFGGTAGCAGIGYLKIQPGSAQLLREQDRVGFAWWESETLGKTVAQDKDRFRRRSVPGLSGQDQRDPKYCHTGSHDETLNAQCPILNFSGGIG